MVRPSPHDPVTRRQSGRRVIGRCRRFHVKHRVPVAIPEGSHARKGRRSEAPVPHETVLRSSWTVWAARMNGSRTLDGGLVLSRYCRPVRGLRTEPYGQRQKVGACCAGMGPPSGVPAESAPRVSRETERLPVCARRVRVVTSATREVRTSKSSHAPCWCRRRDATRWWAGIRGMRDPSALPTDRFT